MAAINQAIKEGKAAQTERVLRNPAVALRGVVPACAAGYQRVLEGAVAEKRRPGNRPGNAPLTRVSARPAASGPAEPPPLTGACAGDTAFWVRHDMEDGTAYYLHLQTFQGTWERPPGGCLNTSHLTRQEIQVGGAPAGGGARGGAGAPCGRGSHPPGTGCSLPPPQSAVTTVTAAHDRQQLWAASEGLVVRLQARLRGVLARRRFAQRSRLLRTWLPAVVRIQVAGSGLPWLRGAPSPLPLCRAGLG